MKKWAFFSIVLLLLGCGEKHLQERAQRLTPETTCAMDGMILMDFAGSKAQILWKDGHRTFYCEAREAFSVWLDPIQKPRISIFFLQDLGGVPWGAYVDRWHPAAQMYLVIDSKKAGAMGLSYVPFLNRKDAEAFQSTHGGQLIPLAKITEKTLEHSEALMRQHPKRYTPIE
ncbi:MAG: nitrous oxide reductase accessory protein NosL [Legionellales bacterium]|nr:nitrous oxide reductase accessory protein NosL [Legionellales bacterium]